MPEPTRAYTDIDYESFPVADLSLDLHWIQLPKAALPENHKVILVPAHPDHSPIAEELWPMVTHTVYQVLQNSPPRTSPSPQR